MVRRSTPQRIVDDRAFPVRVRIIAPRFGIGLDYFGMIGWLDSHVGQGEHARHGGGRSGDRDALAFYFRRPEHAAAFLAAFPALELADRVESSDYSSPHRRRPAPAPAADRGG